MKFQAAEQSLLGVAHAVAQVLDYPDAKLSDTVKELRNDASSLLLSLAERLRKPSLDTGEFLTELKDGVVGLLSKAVEAGENPENEIDFSVQTAKKNLAVVLEHYADQLQNGKSMKKLLTHPALTSFAKATLDAVGSKV
jgi:hypothetical protein